MNSVWSPPVFDSSKHDWDAYQAQLDVQFRLADLKADENGDRRVLMLLSVLSPDTFRQVRDACVPVEPDTKTYAQLVAVMKRLFGTKTSKMTQRAKFGRRLQAEGEDVATYLAELRRLSIGCNFGAQLDDRICEQFITDLRVERIQSKLFAVGEDNLKLNRAFELASAMKLTSKGVAEVNAQHNMVYQWKVSKARVTLARTAIVKRVVTVGGNRRKKINLARVKTIRQYVDVLAVERLVTKK